MVNGEPKLKKQPLDPKIHRVIAEHGGLWIQRIDAGSCVMKGDVLGELVDLLGNTLEVIEAPGGGVICSSRTSVAVNQGDVLAQVAEV
jgi:predicted deacylase